MERFSFKKFPIVSPLFLISLGGPASCATRPLSQPCVSIILHSSAQVQENQTKPNPPGERQASQQMHGCLPLQPSKEAGAACAEQPETPPSLLVSAVSSKGPGYVTPKGELTLRQTPLDCPQRSLQLSGVKTDTSTTSHHKPSSPSHSGLSSQTWVTLPSPSSQLAFCLRVSTDQTEQQHQAPR